MYQRYKELIKEAHKIKSDMNRRTVESIIYSADNNAGQTIHDDKDRTQSDYDWLFTASIGSILANGEHNTRVCEWFETRGISY